MPSFTQCFLSATSLTPRSLATWIKARSQTSFFSFAFDGHSRSSCSGNLTFTGKLKGDEISGVQSGTMGEIPCKGVRATGDDIILDHDEIEEVPEDREAWLDKLEADYEARGRRAVPRDAFNVFNNPEMTPASKAKTVQFEEPVVGVYAGGVAKAYPISTLKSSELVNDMCGDVPIAASW